MVKRFVEQNLQSTVGYWTEEEVEKKALQWKTSQTMQSSSKGSNDDGAQQGGCVVSKPQIDEIWKPSNSEALVLKRKQAKMRIADIGSLEEAKALLYKLCDEGGEWLLDKING